MADGKGKTIPGDRANVRKGALSLELIIETFPSKVAYSLWLTAEEAEDGSRKDE